MATIHQIPRPEHNARDGWKQRLAEIGAKEGFYEELGDEHSALFVKHGKTLIVTFDNLDLVDKSDKDRMPWGFHFAESRNWSVLGIMAEGWTWYRDKSVFDFFDRMQKEGFFKQFDKVVFYGASMGAYAACAFSCAAPDATVIAISPQATLDRELTVWETRFRKAWRRDYSGRYGYAPDMVKKADKVYLFYDPMDNADAMHACLFQSKNIAKVRCRYMGHRIASLWMSMKILKPIIEGCVDGTITTTGFYKLFRNRRDSLRYQKEMLIRLKKERRHKLMVLYCEYILSKRPGPHFRRELRAAKLALQKKTPAHGAK